MNNLLRLRIWPSFLASSGVSVPATYRSGTPRNQSRGTAGRVARWDVHLRGLATAIHKISGLANESGVFLVALNEVNLFNIENLVLGPVQDRACGGQSAIALPVKIYEIPNSKHQITNKSQIPILKDQNRFGILNFGHCYLFDICHL